MLMRRLAQDGKGTSLDKVNCAGYHGRERAFVFDASRTVFEDPAPCLFRVGRSRTTRAGTAPPRPDAPSGMLACHHKYTGTDGD